MRIPLVTTSFPNLQSLKLRYCGSLGMAFLKDRGSDLYQLDFESLHDDDESVFDELKKIKFSKLERLRIGHWVPSNITQHIIETAPNLTSACYATNDDAPEKGKMSQFINEIVSKKGTFCDLYVSLVDDSDYLECISRTIEFALQSTRRYKRKMLRIGIECKQRMDYVETGETLGFVSRILNQLLLCDVHEYALFIQLRTKKECRDSLMNDVKELVDDLEYVELVRSEGFVFIIRSKGSKMNSYKKWWNDCGRLTDRVIY